jgi:hypothetical protein
MNTTASEKAFAQALTISAAKTAVIDEREPVKLLSRIGSVTFVTNVRFNNNATETLEDKILRLIESEVAQNA